MQSLFTKQLLIGFGAAGIIIVTTAAAFLSLPSGKNDPARMVPAEETIAFFTNITTQNIGTFSAHIGALANVPVTDTPSAVALLKTGSGKTGWAVVEPVMGGDQPFTIRTSDPSFDPLFQAVTNPLSRQYSYSALADDETSLPSGWLAFPSVALKAQSPVASLLQTNQPVMMISLADGLELRLVTDGVRLPMLTSGPKELFEKPLFIIHVSNGTAFLDLLSDTFQNDDVTVLQTVLQSTLTNFFGKELSPTYDLPPLLEGTTTLEVAKKDTGNGLRVYLEGEMPDDEATLDHLTDLFLATLKTASVHTETFDDKFNWQDIRQDESLIDDTTKTEYGWTVRTLRQKNADTVLVKAIRSNRYILSNDTDAVEKAVSQTASSLAGLDDIPAALGLIHSAEWNAFLHHTLPTVSKGAIVPAGTSGHMKWKMSQNGRILTIVLKKI